MIAAGVAYFESNTEDRFPPNWAIADLFVRELFEAMESARRGATP
jgi:hypothetical protein